MHTTNDQCEETQGLRTTIPKEVNSFQENYMPCIQVGEHLLTCLLLSPCSSKHHYSTLPLMPFALIQQYICLLFYIYLYCSFGRLCDDGWSASSHWQSSEPPVTTAISCTNVTGQTLPVALPLKNETYWYSTDLIFREREQGSCGTTRDTLPVTWHGFVLMCSVL